MSQILGSYLVSCVSLLLAFPGLATCCVAQDIDALKIELKLAKIQLNSCLRAYETSQDDLNSIDRTISKQTLPPSDLAEQRKRALSHSLSLEQSARQKAKRIAELEAAISDSSAASATNWIKQTGRQLDFAIKGNGYIAITDTQSEAILYTRDLRLEIDQDGYLVHPDGFMLEPPVNIPMDAISISCDSHGVFSVTTPGFHDSTQIGQIELAMFENKNCLTEHSEGVFRLKSNACEAKLDSPGKGGRGKILQGYLEVSYQQQIRELVDSLHQAIRSYSIHE